ncbi:MULTISPECIES: NAD(P)/FAD-dependent oxidoreductase [unclassified Acinetobacter]|uniref:NAD(P)/FAD-dependent oxidoreductase n=1 Tax=unclassified Acinetobacter TaxID=196816 RepID=UPI0019097CF0|nr:MULTISPECIES: FAD-dependent oxidoreductase [unclassified Acinetobacter]MBK0064960.1 FAD-dependent oxidoreductase [Acinetobacter sp. S55]MBK0067349.1 FAD-dependent oxidoreductase [Acinetobacter sp. S54]
MHIAIIGAGISGLLTALELIEQGCQVSIFDQQQAGQAASWAGGGILSPMYPWRYPQAVNTLAQYGKSMYQTWNEKLRPNSGIDFEIHDTGMLIFDEDDFDIGLNYAERYQEPMQQAEYLTPDALKQINPWIHPKFQHAIYFPELSNIRNPRLLQSVIAYLKQHPLVNFVEQTHIIKFQIQQHQVQYAIDQHGNKIQADQFVLATGAWSQDWTEQLNLEIPVQPVQGQMVLFKAPAHWLPTMCMNKVMYLIPRQDGHIVCGSSMAYCGFNTLPDAKTRHNIVEACLEMVPELSQFPIVKQWAGLRPSSPTGIPYIGAVPEVNNLWMNVGHFRNGLCMGPASAQLLRQLMLKQPTFIDPTPYSPERLNSEQLIVS